MLFFEKKRILDIIYAVLASILLLRMLYVSIALFSPFFFLITIRAECFISILMIRILYANVLFRFHSSDTNKSWGTRRSIIGWKLRQKICEVAFIPSLFFIIKIHNRKSIPSKVSEAWKLWIIGTIKASWVIVK